MKTVTAFALFLGVLGGSPASRAIAADDTGTHASEDAAQAELLKLPVYDIALPQVGAEGYKIGDHVELKLLDASPDVGAVQFEPLGGADAKTKLNQAGFDLLPSESPSIVFVKAGTLSLPSLIVKDAEGKAVARTSPVEIVVAADPDESQEPAPPEAPLTIGLPLWLVGLSGTLILALIAAAVWGARKWSKSRKSMALPQVPVTPPTEDAVALAGLADLESKKMYKTPQYKAHFFGISELLKEFLGLRFGFDAPESTTAEMLSHLRAGHWMEPQAIDEIKTLFDQLDRVKFTDYKAAEPESIEALRLARAIVIKHRRPAVAIAPVMPVSDKGGGGPEIHAVR